jgi:hypothetical protein
MAQLNDAMFAGLRDRGYTGALPDMRYAFFKAEGVGTWREFYLANGGTGQLNDWLLAYMLIPPTPAPTVSIVPSAPSVSEGTTINYVASATGDPVLLYQWNLDGAPIGGATSATYNRVTVIGDNAKTITCVVTDGIGREVTSNVSTMTVIVIAPGINWPYPQNTSQLPTWVKIGSSNTITINTSQFSITTGTTASDGYAYPVTVTPGQQYRTSMTGGSGSSTVPTRLLKVGTSVNSSSLGSVEFPANWIGATRTVTFTPATSTVWVSVVGKYGHATNYGAAFRDVSCVPI